MDLTKFLGIYIDDELTWRDGILNVCRKTAMCIAIFNKVKCILNTKSMYVLYCALIFPHLTYCVDVWAIITKQT